MLVSVDRLRALQQNDAFKKYAVITASTFIILLAFTFMLMMFKPKVKDSTSSTKTSESDSTTLMETSSADLITTSSAELMAASSTETSKFDTTLLAVIAIIREGAHAPESFGVEDTRKYFPNLENELTDFGINGSFELGRYLGKRYVESGFLRYPLLPSEVYFRSQASSKHLHSAALVGSGMWPGVNFTAVPIYSEEKEDEIIRGAEEMVFGCDWSEELFVRVCKSFKEMREQEVNFERFNALYECLNPNASVPIENGELLAKAEDLMYKEANGMNVSEEWFENVKTKLYRFEEKVNDYWFGANDFRNIRTLTSFEGPFLKAILEKLHEQWKEYKDFGSIKKKFTAFFVEQYLVFTLLHALGCGKAALGESYPKYNALLMLELHEKEITPMVKLLYKESNMDSAMDITQDVRGCCFTPCDFEKFVDHCNDIAVDFKDRCQPVNKTA